MVWNTPSSDIWCGDHMVWTTVLHTIYDLLSTVYICCGGMVWVYMSCADVHTRHTNIRNENLTKKFKSPQKLYHKTYKQDIPHVLRTLFGLLYESLAVQVS